METSDSTNEPRERSSHLAAEFRDLRNLFYLATFALLVMGVGVNIYLGKQMRFARTKLAEQRQIVGKVAEGFQSTSEPMVREFAAAMQSFASTNKDFAPIFDKYRPALSKYLLGATPAAPPGR
jgi:hypothetical protein